MRPKLILQIAAGWLILALTPGAFAAAVSWTGAGDGTSWGDANNWSGKKLPGSGDDATIPALSGNPTVQISSSTGTALAHSLTSSLPITVSGGTLQAATTIQVSANLLLSGGTLRGRR